LPVFVLVSAGFSGLLWTVPGSLEWSNAFLLVYPFPFSASAPTASHWQGWLGVAAIAAGAVLIIAATQELIVPSDLVFIVACIT
jgi:hypothetical protein